MAFELFGQYPSRTIKNLSYTCLCHIFLLIYGYKIIKKSILETRIKRSYILKSYVYIIIILSRILFYHGEIKDIKNKTSMCLKKRIAKNCRAKTAVSLDYTEVARPSKPFDFVNHAAVIIRRWLKANSLCSPGYFDSRRVEFFEHAGYSGPTDGLTERFPVTEVERGAPRV